MGNEGVSKQLHFDHHAYLWEKPVQKAVVAEMERIRSLQLFTFTCPEYLPTIDRMVNNIIILIRLYKRK